MYYVPLLQILDEAMEKKFWGGGGGCECTILGMKSDPYSHPSCGSG